VKIGWVWREWIEDLYLYKRPCEHPEDLWQQRNKKTQLARYSASGPRRRLQETEKKTGQPSPTEKEQASRQIHIKQAKTNRRRECCDIRSMTARKIEGLRVWRANR